MVLGLGNPGPRYERTRHNAGFLVAEGLRAAGQGRGWSVLGERQETRLRIGAYDLVAARPLTYMNRSGVAARDLLAAYALLPAEMLVVADDVALSFGTLRIRPRGGAGGHRGLLSIAEEIGTLDFPRLRLGVGAPPDDGDLAEFVLRGVEGEEWDAYQREIVQGVEAVRTICSEGLERAMNRFNPAVPPAGPAIGEKPAA